MRNWDIRDEVGNCAFEKDFEDARWICDKLKIPLIQVDFVKEYWNEVFRYLYLHHDFDYKAIGWLDLIPMNNAYEKYKSYFVCL